MGRSDDFRIHDLRHSFESFGADGGDSLLIIGALLGHRSAQATERYAHLSSGPLKRAADRISSEIPELLESRAADASGEEAIDLSSAAPEALAPVRTILGQVVKARWLDRKEVAARVNLTATTLQTYRWMVVGPPSRGSAEGLFTLRTRSTPGRLRRHPPMNAR